MRFHRLLANRLLVTSLHAPVAAGEPLPVLVSILPQQSPVERVGRDWSPGLWRSGSLG
jgi:hypothetical protein